MSKQIITSISFIIASVVVLSSLHAVQVVGTTTHAADEAKKITHEDIAAKVVHDLHHHSDKSGMQLIKDVGDHQYVDNRSLRLSRDNKKDTLRHRFSARWQRAMQNIALLHVHRS